MQNSPKGNELDPTIDVRRQCKKNSPTVLYNLHEEKGQKMAWP